MTNIPTSVDISKWHPICSSTDLPKRHVYHGQLLGHEFAVWRADDGNVNAWENRCLHRGVRLSIGLNEGQELRCLYHGWRYANRTASCTYIPAHPADSPARTISNRTYECVEAHGLVWVSIDPSQPFTAPEILQDADTVTLRPFPINATAEHIATHISNYKFSPTADDKNINTKLDLDSTEVTVNQQTLGYTHLTAKQGDDSAELLLFIQPLDSARSVLRGVLVHKTPATKSAAESTVQQTNLPHLRHHNSLMNQLRESIEREAEGMEKPKPFKVKFARVSPEQAEIADQSDKADIANKTKSQLRVKLAKKTKIAEGICGFRFEALAGQLPAFQPGAHIDVQLPNGLTKQYSLTNSPVETDHYSIAVKLDPNSQGGSSCLHNEVREGDVLAISAPRNNFPLRRDVNKIILIAGGIGVTPILAMAQALDAQDIDFELHYFSQSQAHMGFETILQKFGSRVVPHLGYDPQKTKASLTEILANYQPAEHCYICGPAPMLEASRAIAAAQNWPEEAVHFEYFKNTNEIDDSSSFEIALARSAVTLQVPAGKTILQVLQENGIQTASSCEQGACGTCSVTVLEGEVDHQDVYLSDKEKAADNTMMTCVSRAKSSRLVLDI